MKYLLIISLFFGFVACKQPSGSKKEQKKQGDLERFMKDFNKDAALEELEQIDLLLERYQWDVTETGSGVRYWIYKKGNGDFFKNGDRIKCYYTLNLINGKKVYDSDNDGLLRVEVGKSDIAPGLSEAILLLREGDYAKVIVPSNLGYGLAGDGNKIPTRATLIYDLQNIRKEQNK